jgi:hypothetical protein
MIILGYIWRVAVNVVVLLIVAWTLENLQGRTETLIIPVLGLIYVTIRTSFGYTGIAMADLAISHQEQLVAIRSWIDGTFSPVDHTPDRLLLKRVRNKFYIDGSFLFLISLLCMATFFSHL